MPIEKINQGDQLSQSADLVNDNIDKLKMLFPEIVTEGKNRLQGATAGIGRRVGRRGRILPFYLGRKVSSKTRSAQTFYRYFTTSKRGKFGLGHHSKYVYRGRQFRGVETPPKIVMRGRLK